MTNTYVINTTRGKEFKVEDDLTAMGLKPWVPKRLVNKPLRKKDKPIWFDQAYIPKLMFCVIPAIYFRDVLELKHVIGNPGELSRRDIEGVPAHTKRFTDRYGREIHVAEIPGLKRFKDAVEAEYADAQRRQRNNEYQCAYEPGQALEMLSGAFEGLPAVFHDVMRQAHDEYAKLRVKVTVFGRETTVELDPDKVRAAE